MSLPLLNGCSGQSCVCNFFVSSSGKSHSFWPREDGNWSWWTITPLVSGHLHIQGLHAVWESLLPTPAFISWCILAPSESFCDSCCHSAPAFKHACLDLPTTGPMGIGSFFLPQAFMGGDIGPNLNSHLGVGEWRECKDTSEFPLSFPPYTREDPEPRIGSVWSQRLVQG